MAACGSTLTADVITMSGSKGLDGFIILEELMPVLDSFLVEADLLMCSRHRNIVSPGLNRYDLRPLTRIAMYPTMPGVSAQRAMDQPGPSRAILVDLPFPTERALPLFHMGAQFDWWENDRAHVDRDVVPRFDQLRRRLLKIMGLGPYEGYTAQGPQAHVYRGSHYSTGALDWISSGGEWVYSPQMNTRFRPPACREVGKTL
jgi:hypothetical protein